MKEFLFNLGQLLLALVLLFLAAFSCVKLCGAIDAAKRPACCEQRGICKDSNCKVCKCPGQGDYCAPGRCSK